MEATQPRDSEQTRAEILDAAYREVYEYGFRAASLERILRNTRLTKGALYHHFPNKQAMGLAVVDEVVGNYMRKIYIGPLEATEDPIGLMEDYFSKLAEGAVETKLRCGCPLNNLSQEMSGLDEEFREHLRAIFQEWRTALADALRRGQVRGNVRADADVESVATFVIAVNEGMIGMGKTYRDPGVLRHTAHQLRNYLNTLRP